MKKILLAFLLPLAALAQTAVQKVGGGNNTISNGSIVVGNNTSLTATGSGSIIATGGVASSLPWSGLTAIPSPTITATGNVTGNFTLSASGVASAALTVVSAPASVLTGTTLASNVVTSSLTTVGTIASGTWQGTVLAGQYGGNGVANTGTTFTRAGNVVFSGAFASTFTFTNTTAVTFPTSGTLATVGGTVASITGTANQISASASTGAVTLSLPSAITAPGSLTTTTSLTAGTTVTFSALNTANGLLQTNGIGVVSTTLTPSGVTSLGVGSITFPSPSGLLDLGTVTVDGNYTHEMWGGGSRYSLTSSRAIFSSGGFINIPDYTAAWCYNPGTLGGGVAGDVQFQLTFEAGYQSSSGRTTEHYYDWAGVLPTGTGGKRLYQFNTSWGSAYGGTGPQATPGYTNLTFNLEEFSVDSTGIGSTSGLYINTSNTSARTLAFGGTGTFSGMLKTTASGAGALTVQNGGITTHQALSFDGEGSVAGYVGGVVITGTAAGNTLTVPSAATSYVEIDGNPSSGAAGGLYLTGGGNTMRFSGSVISGFGIWANDSNAPTANNVRLYATGLNTVLNAATGGTVQARINNTTQMTVDATGAVTATTFVGALTGNADTATTATRLATARTLAITGDLSWTSPSFDGSGNVTAAGTLATVASAGTTGSSTAIPVITINAKGLTTSITTAAVVAPAGTLTGGTLASGVTASSLTSVGTLTGLTVSGSGNFTGTTTSTSTSTGTVVIGNGAAGGLGVGGALFVGGTFSSGGNATIFNSLTFSSASGSNSINAAAGSDIALNAGTTSSNVRITNSYASNDTLVIKNTDATGNSSTIYKNNSGTTKAGFGYANASAGFQPGAAYVYGASGVPIYLSPGDDISAQLGAASQTSWTTTGAEFALLARTFTNTSTAASGTAATATFTSHAKPTLAATNANVTTTDAINVYIAGSVTQGSQQILTRTHALATGSGRVSLAYAGSTSSEDGLWWGTDVNAFRSAANTLTLTASSGVVATGSFTSSAPSGGTAAAWKFGTVVTGITATMVTTNYIQLDVGGTLYKLATVTSVP